MRRVGDPLADPIIKEIFEGGDIETVRRLLRHLVDNDHPLDVPERTAQDLGPEVVKHLERYFALSDAELPEMDAERIVAGERVFAQHGPEILMILGCYSLPASYAARKGVQVLAQTGQLESHTKRRLFETTQMVVDVLKPGGLSLADSAHNHGKGVRSAQKVRLMHAAIRHMILDRGGESWVDQFDVPINQEDIAGTLMTFSWIVLDGLERIGARLSDDEREAYLYAWRSIGPIMGLRAELIPSTVAEADELTHIIQRRQIAPSQAGDAMAAALVEMMRDMLHTSMLRGLPPTLIRFFLRKYGDIINLPPADWTVVLVQLMHGMTLVFDGLLGRGRVSGWLYRRFNLALIRAMLELERGGQRTPFDIPDHLAQAWGLHD